jgi:coiled-coil domain-containing protein 6
MPDPIRTARVASGSDADAAPDGVNADASASLERALALERAKTTTLEEELRRVRSSAEKLAQTVEAEEEFLVRTLNKKLDALTHENATLTHAMRTQRVDDALERRLRTLQEEKVQMENALEREQECMMHRLTSVLENLGRENQSVSKERDRLSFETARLKGGEGANGKRVGERGGTHRELAARTDIAAAEEEQGAGETGESAGGDGER